MFIDLKNGTCINIDQVYGVTTSSDEAEFLIRILLKSVNMLNENSKSDVYVKFKHPDKANKYLEQYFGMATVF